MSAFELCVLFGFFEAFETQLTLFAVVGMYVLYYYI